jgi:hypothetical protein
MAAASKRVATLSAQDRHLVNRFSYGVTPALAARVIAVGGAHHWLSRQLKPTQIPDPIRGTLRLWYPSLTRSPENLFLRHKNGIESSFEVEKAFARAMLMRRIYTHRQIVEFMTEFWSNHLHVPVPEPKSWPHRMTYDTTIRKHALGRFDEMLIAAVTHPAMGCYLDNAKSTKKNPNENLGRELLELHTVGIGAGYSEQEVVKSALMLTGYRVDIGKTAHAFYDTSVHYQGQLKVLGFTDANTSSDGRASTHRYLRYLAHHPLTAQRIAKKLCVHFVRDRPPASIVAAVAKTFRDSGTDIKATLRTLVAHPDFAGAVSAKTRTPTEDYVATARVLGIRATRPHGDDSFANEAIWQARSMGQFPFDWPRPDGFPDTAASWTGVARMLNSFRIHDNLAGGYFPTRDVTYRSPGHWLPHLPATFETVMVHMAKMLIGRRPSADLRSALVTRTGIHAAQRVHRDDLPDYMVVRMLQTILDAPSHMTR